MREKIRIYVTFNGLPVFILTNTSKEENYLQMSSFLHAIDIFAKEAIRNIGRSTEFYGFAFANEIEVSVMEVMDENGSSRKGEGRLFIETPFGKVPSNNNPIVALLGATRAAISKISNKELNPNFQLKEIADYFKDRLKDRGYTPDKVMTELGDLKVSKTQFLGYRPISLFSIEEVEKEADEEKKEKKYQVKDIGNYNEGKSKKNPVKNEEGKLTFNPSLITGMAGALKAYQSETAIEKEAIILRFKDCILEISYKQNGMPIVGILVKGSGTPEEVLRYREDIKKLEL